MTATNNVFRIEDFLSNSECDAIMYLVETSGILSPSTVVMPDGKHEEDKSRFSFTGHLYHGKHELINKIDQWIATITNTELTEQEPMQVQYYPRGGYYKPHLDAFDGEGGKRQHTFMVYLNDVIYGGATVFPKLGISIKPAKGLAVYWQNLYDNGKPNLNMIHEAQKTDEPKCIITKWIRKANLEEEQKTHYSTYSNGSP